MQIADLQPLDTIAIEQAGHTLVAGFREQAPDTWPDRAATRTEVHKARPLRFLSSRQADT